LYVVVCEGGRSGREMLAGVDETESI